MNLNRLLKTIGKDEGCKLKLYRCTSNKLTIGIGRNIEDNGIRKDEVKLMFKNDVDEVVNNLAPALKRKFGINFNSLSDIRQEVLLNMAFQLGIPRLLKFKNTFRYLKNKSFKKCSIEMLNSLWAKQTPKRAKRLSNLMKGGK